MDFDTPISSSTLVSSVLDDISVNWLTGVICTRFSEVSLGVLLIDDSVNKFWWQTTYLARSASAQSHPKPSTRWAAVEEEEH